MSAEITALIVAVPAADPVVGSFRSVLDSGATAGVPAHVTILYPFMPVDALDADVIGELSALFAGIAAFEFSLRSIAWFGQQVVYVRPEPDVMLRQLTKRVFERWPRWAPYGGAHADPTPHLTIGDNGDLPAMERAAHAVSRRLPIDVTVAEVELYAGTAAPGSWHRRMTFPLRTQPT